MKPKFGLPKSARLRHRNVILRLHDEGQSHYVHPLRMTSLIQSRERMAGLFRGRVPEYVDRVQMMVVIPKKKFHHAVDRVLLRRRVREAYRLNRTALIEMVQSKPDLYLSLCFTYVGDTAKSYASIEKRMKKLLEKALSMVNPPLKELREPTPTYAIIIHEREKDMEKDREETDV